MSSSDNFSNEEKDGGIFCKCYFAYGFCIGFLPGMMILLGICSFGCFVLEFYWLLEIGLL